MALFKIAILFCVLVHLTMAAVDDQNMLFQYHNGPLLHGKIAVNLIWYGKFTPSERSIVADFVTSLSSSSAAAVAGAQPSVATWWKATEKYYKMAKSNKASPLALSLGTQILDEGCSLGKALSRENVIQLASKGPQRNSINVVLTAADVTVSGQCSSSCGTHGSSSGAGKDKVYKFAYIWVGNSATQCPGQCAWPFHKPIYGPQTPALISPNNNVGMDGIIINMAALLAGTATNPFGNGYFQGPAAAPLEAATACTGIFGSGAYPGNPGNVLEDPTSGASFNAVGANGRKYLLPALVDPSTSECFTLV